MSPFSIRARRLIAAILLSVAGGVFASSIPSLPETSRKFDADGDLSRVHEAYYRLTDKEDAAALATVKDLAAKGDPYALFVLGRYHAGGYSWVAADFKKDSEKAESLMAQAAGPLERQANKGEPFAQLLYGLALENGRGVPKDTTAALQWYRKSADQDYAPALYSLGVLYLKGEGVAKDEAAAAKWFRMAAEQGVSYAQGALGYMLMNGMGIAKDEAAAVGWYRKAAEQGNAEYQYQLSQALKSGKGGEQDYEAAESWLLKAAEQGHREAKFLILNRSPELRKAIQADFSRFPLLARKQTPQGRPAWQKLLLNKDPLIVDGFRIDGFRFLCTAKNGEDFLWAVRLPATVRDWYIVPETGNMDGTFREFIRYPISSGERLIYQGAESENFKAGDTYMIWFRFTDDKPTTFPVAYTFGNLKSDNDSGIYKTDELAELLGTSE